MVRTAVFILCAVACGLPTLAQSAGPSASDKPEPALAVSGRAEVLAQPDMATVRFGAVAQEDTAGAAQQQVNKVMQSGVAAMKKLGIPDASLTTVGINLYPVYSQPPPRALGDTNPKRFEPEIIGYRASNTLQVELSDLSKVGPVIDAGVKAGANNVEGLSFHLKDDSKQRQEALRRAAAEARAKADAIAGAMGVKLDSVLEVVESGVNIIQPRMEFKAMARVAEASYDTPVQPGQVRVEASLSVRYKLANTLVK